MANHFVSATCQGEKCSVCGEAATHKVGEEIPHDEPPQTFVFENGEKMEVPAMRHNYTTYLCCTHFSQIMGPHVREHICQLAAPEPAPTGAPPTSILIDGPPMSFEAAKIALFRYTDMPDYLKLALNELAGMDYTRAIKQAAEMHLRRAAGDFESRRPRKR